MHSYNLFDLTVYITLYNGNIAGNISNIISISNVLAVSKPVNLDELYSLEDFVFLLMFRNEQNAIKPKVCN